MKESLANALETTLPDMSDEQYRVFNQIRHHLSFDDVEVTYKLDADEWRDQLSNSGTVIKEYLEPSIHCSSSIVYDIRMGNIILSVNGLCGVYLSEKSLYANEFAQCQYSIKVIGNNEELKQQIAGEVDGTVGDHLYDLAKRNIQCIVLQESDWKNVENQFRLDLLKHFDIAPSQLFNTLLAQIA